MGGVQQQCQSWTTCSLAIVKTRRETFCASFCFETIERLQMAHNSYHVPVLASEIVELLSGQPVGVVVDATLGGGGHARALLEGAPQLRILGIDRDPDARAASGERLREFGDRVRIVDATFGELAEVVKRHDDFIGDDPVVGVLMDLGVSSHQLDETSRGFSFRSNAPLDMRMDPTKGETAAEFLSRVDRHEFTRLLRANGEGRFASAIAKWVLELQPTTTDELTAAVERAVPAGARRRGHVATRVFQTLRIVVNAEEEQLVEGLEAALDVLSIGGVVAIISYHSGEDRVVKSVLHEAATGGCHCPLELGCACGAVPRVTVYKASAKLSGVAEIAQNPRARSARLRMARKVSP